MIKTSLWYQTHHIKLWIKIASEGMNPYFEPKQQLRDEFTYFFRRTCITYNVMHRWIENGNFCSCERNSYCAIPLPVIACMPHVNCSITILYNNHACAICKDQPIDMSGNYININGKVKASILHRAGGKWMIVRGILMHFPCPPQRTSPVKRDGRSRPINLHGAAEYTGMRVMSDTCSSMA